jgi:hypothetical protein
VIQFLAPWAGAGLILLAGPVLVHMLLRRRARHVLFPATRFLVETRAAAVRLRRPSDLTLLLVRLAIVGAAIAAAAQPVIVTARRLARWDARIVRAVVVDTSASARRGGDIARLVEQELGAFRAERFEGADARDQLARATAWLADAPPARREVVILSDFQRGSLDRDDLAAVPAGVGIRTIRVATLPPSREVPLPGVAGFRGSNWQPAMQVDGAGTRVTWRRSASEAPPSWLTTSQADRERDAASRAVYAATSPGVAAGDDSRRVRVRFAGAPDDAPERASLRTQWMVDAVLALRESALLRQTGATVQASELRGELVVDTNVTAASVDAAAVLRAVVLAVRPPDFADREAEIASVTDAELATWRRDAAPVSTTTGIPSDSDARWFWAVALALLGVETWLRGRHEPSRTQQVRDAA